MYIIITLTNSLADRYIYPQSCTPEYGIPYINSGVCGMH